MFDFRKAFPSLSRLVLAILVLSPLLSRAQYNLNSTVAPNGTLWYVTDSVAVSAKMVPASGGTLPNGTYTIFGVGSVNGHASPLTGFATIVVAGGVSPTVAFPSAFGGAQGGPGNAWGAGSGEPPWTTDGGSSSHSIYTSACALSITQVKFNGTPISFSCSQSPMTASVNFSFSSVSSPIPSVTQTPLLMNISLAPASPQSLTVTGNNSSAFSQTVYLTKSGGSPIAIGNIPANGSATLTYTPATGMDGVYAVSYGQTALGTSAILTVATTVLPSPSTLPYSDTWSNAAVSISVGAGASANSPKGTVTNNSGSSVSTVWKDSAGNVVATGPTIANGQTYSVDTSGLPSLTAGQTQTVGLYNATTGASYGNITLSNTGDGNGTTSTGTISATISGAASSSTPVAGQTNAGNTSVGTSVNGSGTTQVNNSNTSISGTTSGATNQDIYNDVKQALLDAGNQGVPSSSNLSLGPYVAPTDGAPTETKTAADLAAQVSMNTDELTDAATALQETMSSVSTLQPSFGAVPAAVASITFPVPVALFKVSAFTVDFSPYTVIVGIFRAACEIALAVKFYFSVIRYLRSGLADAGR